AATARAPGGYPSLGGVFCREIWGTWRANQTDRAANHGRAPEISVAGQHSRAGKRDRACMRNLTRQRDSSRKPAAGNLEPERAQDSVTHRCGPALADRPGRYFRRGGTTIPSQGFKKEPRQHWPLRQDLWTFPAQHIRENCRL